MSGAELLIVADGGGGNGYSGSTGESEAITAERARRLPLAR